MFVSLLNGNILYLCTSVFILYLCTSVFIVYLCTSVFILLHMYIAFMSGSIDKVQDILFSNFR